MPGQQVGDPLADDIDRVDFLSAFVFVERVIIEVVVSPEIGERLEGQVESPGDFVA